MIVNTRTLGSWGDEVNIYNTRIKNRHFFNRTHYQGLPRMASNRSRMMLKTAAATLAVVAIAGVSGAWLVLESGWYHIGATRQHWQVVHSVLEQGMHESVKFHAREVRAPALGGAAQVARGAAVYRDNCAQCHGAPGVAQQNFAQAMQPLPGPLVDASQRWQARELYWITRNGIKMSGMPAWEFHLADADIWAVVAFMERLPTLSAGAYAAATAPASPAAPVAESGARVGGDPARGRVALTQYACNACHMIDGVTGSTVYVGRSLKRLGARKFIAGSLPNTQENLMRWIENPKAIDPQTAMPVLGVSTPDARDISAYLLTLH
jgi:mono/diheme cytochrome c family protein